MLQHVPLPAPQRDKGERIYELIPARPSLHVGDRKGQEIDCLQLVEGLGPAGTRSSARKVKQRFVMNAGFGRRSPISVSRPGPVASFLQELACGRRGRVFAALDEPGGKLGRDLLRPMAVLAYHEKASLTVCSAEQGTTFTQSGAVRIQNSPFRPSAETRSEANRSNMAQEAIYRREELFPFQVGIPVRHRCAL